MQPSTASQAGTAAPIVHSVPNYNGKGRATVSPVWASNTEDGEVDTVALFVAGEGRQNNAIAFLTPAQARALAVYLVDCANALDNPADRVIADTDEDGANVYPWHPANFEGEGIGHE